MAHLRPWFVRTDCNFLSCNTLLKANGKGEYPSWYKPVSQGKVSRRDRKSIVWRPPRVRFDRLASSGHNCMYVNPVEGRQARRRNAGYTDGAKIYFCHRRCCFLTGKRRSGLLNLLSPRKSWIQSHPSEMRYVPERGPGHNKPVSARRSVRD